MSVDRIRWNTCRPAAMVLFALAAVAAPASTAPPSPAKAEAAVKADAVSPPEIVVYAADLPGSALSEFDFVKDPACPGGKLARTPNGGGELDPPPENDPNVKLKVSVVKGVPYRLWVHMKVGKPKGKSQANMLFAQFTQAVDAANQETLKPGTKSYMVVRGPAREGWVWVGDDASAKSPNPPVVFRNSGEVTIRLQAGMEGVGFDQVVLSPARFLEKPPADPVVKK